MKNENNKPKIYLIIGLLLISVAILLTVFTQLPAFLKGLIAGVGFGMLVLNLYKMKRKPSKPSY
jgi:hypothetical protein